MDSQTVLHGNSYAYTCPHYPLFYDLWVKHLFGAKSEDESVFLSALEERVTERITAKSPNTPDDHTTVISVVDIGTGTGRVIKNLTGQLLAKGAQNANGAVEISLWGVDHSGEMIKRARKTFLDDFKSESFTISSVSGPSSKVDLRVHWERATASSLLDTLPELAGAADLIIFAAGGIGHITSVDELGNFISCIALALRPGGAAVISALDDVGPGEEAHDFASESEGPDYGRALSLVVPESELHTDTATTEMGSAAPARRWYTKSTTVSTFDSNRTILTEHFNVKLFEGIMDAHQSGEGPETLVWEKDLEWSLKNFDGDEFKEMVHMAGAGLAIEKTMQGQIQKFWYLRRE